MDKEENCRAIRNCHQQTYIRKYIRVLFTQTTANQVSIHGQQNNNQKKAGASKLKKLMLRKICAGGKKSHKIFIGEVVHLGVMLGPN